MGAWIEIVELDKHKVEFVSLPSWERGLKYIIRELLINQSVVAPLVGAWIEIMKNPIYSPSKPSLPSWERGLKFLM